MADEIFVSNDINLDVDFGAISIIRQGGSALVIANDYSATNTYSVGDYAIYNYTLYRCTVAITEPEEFDADKWLSVKLADEVEAVNVALASKADTIAVLTYLALKADKADTYTKSEVNTALDAKLPTTGGSLTGGLSAPSFSTGTDNDSYFQSRKFRGEGNANTYYHAIDFGGAGRDQVDFYEWGGAYNFWKQRSEQPTTSNADLALGIRLDRVINQGNEFIFPTQGGTFATQEYISALEQRIQALETALSNLTGG